MESKRNKRRKELFEERNNAGLCAYCGKEKKKRKQMGCTTCAEKRSRIQGEFTKNRKDRGVIYRKRIRKKAIDKYGGVCVCCGEKNIMFLTIDHKNDDGHIERSKGYTGTAFYMKVVRDDFRNDLQVLCYNCNLGRATNNGICPHIKPVDIDCDSDLRTARRFNIGCKAKWYSDKVLLKLYKKYGSGWIAKKLGVSPSAPYKRLKRRNLV